MEGNQGLRRSDLMNRSPMLPMALQSGLPWPGVRLLVELHTGAGICLWKQVLVAGRSAESWKTLAWVSGSMLMLQTKACHFYVQTECHSLFIGDLAFLSCGHLLSVPLF